MSENVKLIELQVRRCVSGPAFLAHSMQNALLVIIGYGYGFLDSLRDSDFPDAWRISNASSLSDKRSQYHARFRLHAGYRCFEISPV
jgi:hypothetical protein